MQLQSKAFDLADHYILLEKLIDEKIPPDIDGLIRCYLGSQSARITWNGCCNEFRSINRGVRQGGILSPLLFKLYINDLINCITSLDMGCRFDVSRVNLIAYADDIVLLAENSANLETIYRIFSSKIKDLKLRINTSKSKIMLFYCKDMKNVPISMTLDNEYFEVVKEIKYLGNIITYNLNDEPDVRSKLNSFYSSFNSYFRSFNGLYFDNFLFLFKSFCLPQYGLELWNSNNIFNRVIFRSFEVAYSNSLKRILGCPKYASSHITADICNQFLFKHQVNVIQARYLHRILRSSNGLFALNRTYMKNGLFFKHVCNYFHEKYSISVLENPISAVISRVCWVQTHEPRSRFCVFFNA